MTRHAAVYLWLLMLIAGAPGRAQEPSRPERRISFEAGGIPLRKVAEKLSRELGIPCRIDPDVPEVRLDLGFRNLKLEVGVGLIIDAAREQHARILGYWEAEQPRTLRFSLDRETIDLDLRGVPLRQAVKKVLEPVGQQYSFDSAVPDVLITLKLERVTYQKALRLIIREAAKQVPGLTYSKGG